jgi:N-formylglutamate amidohydrolase
MISTLLHIPHSSTHIPFYDGFVVGKQTIHDEMDLLTDWFTTELFDLPCPKIVTPFSRIFCDVERFEDDSSEIMAQKGMGMCYTHMDNGDLMRVVGSGLRERIKSEFYHPHHRALEGHISELLYKYGHVTVIDCHSFPDIPLTRDLNQDMPRPDFCLGTDDFHTPKELYLPVQDFLTSLGYKVLINNPYAGTIIPMKYYQTDKNVKGLMIEVNRMLYMTNSDGVVSKTPSFDKICELIKTVFLVLEGN